MSERYTKSPEISKQDAEALERAGIEARGKLGEKLEQASHERETTAAETERATHEALEAAAQNEKAKAEKQTEAAPQEQQADRPLTKQDINAAYGATMKQVQSQLSAPSRTFSKVIHNPVVEATSEVVGNTIARPNLIIAGAIGAIASIVVYMLAKRYGYALSGFETIALFIVGWLIGAIIEYARVGFANHKR